MTETTTTGIEENIEANVEKVAVKLEAAVVAKPEPRPVVKAAKAAIEGDYFAVVQVRGLVGVRSTIKDTLRMLGLTRVNQCVVLKYNQSVRGMLLKVKDYTTFGPVSKEVVTKIVAARGLEYQGRMQDNKEKYSYSCFEFEGKKYKKCFRLNPPRKGYGKNGIKKGFVSGGALGDRGEKIADLIERML